MRFEFPLTPNLTDKTRPLFDTRGNAVKILRAVQLADVNGPDAPAAVMMLGTYYLRRKNYIEAESSFSMLREHYDKRATKLIEAAYILGAHASLMLYQGAQYDKRQLEEAKKLTQQAVRLFPECKQRAKLEHDLRMIDSESAVRAWKRVEYHQRRNEKDSAAFYCELIMESYPDSPQAAQARELLLRLGPSHAAGVLKTPLFKKDSTGPAEREAAPYDEPAEPARLRVSNEDARPVSERK